MNLCQRCIFGDVDEEAVLKALEEFENKIDRNVIIIYILHGYKCIEHIPFNRIVPIRSLINQSRQKSKL